MYHVDLLILKHSCIPGVTSTWSWCVLAALTFVDEAGNTWLEPELGVRHSFSWVQQLSPPYWEWDQVTRCREKSPKGKIWDDSICYICTIPRFSNGTMPPEKGSTRARGAEEGPCCVLEEHLLGLSWHTTHSSSSLLIRCLLECRTKTLDLFWTDPTLPPQAPSTAHSLWQSSLSSRHGAARELASWHGC